MNSISVEGKLKDVWLMAFKGLLFSNCNATFDWTIAANGIALGWLRTHTRRYSNWRRPTVQPGRSVWGEFFTRLFEFKESKEFSSCSFAGSVGSWSRWLPIWCPYDRLRCYSEVAQIFKWSSDDLQMIPQMICKWLVRWSSNVDEWIARGWV